LVTKGKLKETQALVCISIVLIFVAGLRMPGIDRDSVNYIDFFNSFGSPAEYFTDLNKNIFYEPLYYLIPSTIRYTFDLSTYWTFLVIAIIAITLKIYAIKKLTDLALLSVLVYFGHFFILHEMTQIRAGVASAIVLLCIVQIEHKRFLYFIGLILLGTLFHFSIVIFIPFFFLSAEELNKKLYLALLYFPYIMYALKVNILTILDQLHLGVISNKLQLYNDLFEKGDDSEINVFNVLFIIQLIICTVFIIKSEVLYQENRYALLLIKIYAISASFFVLFSAIPIIAFRLSELLQIVQIILLPFLLYLLRPHYVPLLAVIAFALMILTFDLFYVGLLKPYQLNF
jgi:hypothetical protein